VLFIFNLGRFHGISGFDMTDTSILKNHGIL